MARPAYRIVYHEEGATQEEVGTDSHRYWLN